VKLLCSVVSNRLATLEGDATLPMVLDAHVESCLRCQAIQVRERRMRRALSELATHTIAAPDGLVASVEGVISAPRPVVPTASVRLRPTGLRHRIASPGALAGVAAFAAGGAAVAAWRLAKRPA